MMETNSKLYRRTTEGETENTRDDVKTPTAEIKGRIARVMQVCEEKFGEGFKEEELTEEDSRFAQKYYEGKWDIPKFKAELEAARPDLNPSQIKFREIILEGVKREFDRR